MKQQTKTKNQYPPGWNAKRVHGVIDSYDNQSDDEAAAEIEAGFNTATHTVVIVPKKLVPAIKQLIAKSKKRAG